MLAFFIPRFSAERFLYDYVEDGKLLFRRNGVMRRVRLPVLPSSLVQTCSGLHPDLRGDADEVWNEPPALEWRA